MWPKPVGFAAKHLKAAGQPGILRTERKVRATASADHGREAAFSAYPSNHFRLTRLPRDEATNGRTFSRLHFSQTR